MRATELRIRDYTKRKASKTTISKILVNIEKIRGLQEDHAVLIHFHMEMCQ